MFKRNTHLVLIVYGQGNVVQITPPKPLRQSGFKHPSGAVNMLFCAVRQKRYRLDWCLRRVLLHKSVHVSTPLCACLKMAAGMKIKIFIPSRCFYFFCHESAFLSHQGLEQLRHHRGFERSVLLELLNIWYEKENAAINNIMSLSHANWVKIKKE